MYVKYELIIPVNLNTYPHIDKWVKDIAHEAGGVSVYSGEGLWYDPHGELHIESHKRLEVLAETTIAPDVLASIRSVVSDMREAGEQSVLYYTDGEATFV